MFQFREGFGALFGVAKPPKAPPWRLDCLSKRRGSMPLLCVVLPQKSIFCCADFGSRIALDLQHKVKPFLHYSKKQMTLQCFLGIYSSIV